MSLEIGPNNPLPGTGQLAPKADAAPTDASATPVAGDGLRLSLEGRTGAACQDPNAALLAYPVAPVSSAPAPEAPPAAEPQAQKGHKLGRVLGRIGATAGQAAFSVASTANVDTVKGLPNHPLDGAQHLFEAVRQTRSGDDKPQTKAKKDEGHGFKHALGKVGKAIGHTVADVGVGVATGVKDTALSDAGSIKDLATHPVATAHNMASAVRHPVRTIKYMGADDNEIDPTAKDGEKKADGEGEKKSGDEAEKQPQKAPSARRTIARHIGHVGSEFGLGWVTAGVAPVAKTMEIVGHINTFADPVSQVPDRDDAETWDGKHDAKDPGITWKGVFKGAGKGVAGDFVEDARTTFHAASHPIETAKDLGTAARHPLDTADQLDGKEPKRHHRDSGEDFGRGLAKIARSTVGIPIPGKVWNQAQQVAGKGHVVADVAAAGGILAHGDDDAGAEKEKP